MYSFRGLLDKAKKSNKKYDDYLEKDAQLFYKMVKAFYRQYPYASEIEAYNYLEDFFDIINKIISEFPGTKSDTLRYNTCRYLNMHPEKIEEAYNKINKEQSSGKKIYFSSHGEYSANILKATRLLILQSLNDIMGQQKKCGENGRIMAEFFMLPKSEQNKYKRTLDTKHRIELEKLRDLFEGNRITQLTKYLRKTEVEYAKVVKLDYIKSIAQVGEILGRLGLLETYNNNANSVLEKLGLNGLEYPYFEDQQDTISIEGLFDAEQLSRLNINQLSAINAFLINRLSKEIENLNQTFFIVSQLGLMNQIKETIPNEKNGNIKMLINDSKIEVLYKKMAFLKQACDELLRNINEGSNAEKLKKGTSRVVENKTIVQVNFKEFLEDMEKDIGSEYEAYFGPLEEEETRFRQDINSYIVMENAQFQAYRLKDMSLIALLSNLSQGTASKNWGVILEDKEPERSRMILLGADIEGLNMPLRLHMDKKQVTNFMKESHGTSMVPLYEGAEDFTVGGRYIGTQLLMPLCAKQKEAIKQESGANPACHNFLEHLAFLADSTKYPDHLKETVVARSKGKSKLVRKRPNTKYIDLNNKAQKRNISVPNNEEEEK